MQYTEKHKSEILDLLYPFAAKMLGLGSSLHVREDNGFAVRYHSNKYCAQGDGIDNAMHKLTVECDFGERGTVYFIPYPLFNATVFGYRAYVADEEVANIGPYEWEIIRPKVYSNFSEYFDEFRMAIDAFQFVVKRRAADEFILEHYVRFFASFRKTLYSQVPKLSGANFPKSVEFAFESDSIYERPAHEQVIVNRILDNRLMMCVACHN